MKKIKNNWKFAIEGCRVLQELSSGYWKSSVLFTANKMDIFTKISGKELSADQIAKKLDATVDTQSLQIFLDACVAIGLLKKNSGYKNSNLSENFLVRGKKWYQGDIIAHWADMYAAGHFMHLDFTIKNGYPVPDQMLNPDLFDEKRNGLENWVMGMHNWAVAGHAEMLANSVDLKSNKRLLDVGGGPGTYSIFFCKKFPKLSATVLDDEQIIRTAKKIIQAFGMSDRMECTSGNFLRLNSADKYDVILISNVLHMGKKDFAETVLKRAFDTLPAKGKLIVQDWFLNSKKTSPTLSALFSLHIMSRPGGAVYSFDETIESLRKIGFSKIKKIKLPGLWSAIVSEK